MTTITIDDRALRDALARLARAVDDPTEAMNDLGDDLATHIREHLGRGIDPWGAPFTPLKLRQGVPLNDTPVPHAREDEPSSARCWSGRCSPPM